MASLFDFVVMLDERMVVRRVEWYEHLESPEAEEHTKGWTGLSL